MPPAVQSSDTLAMYLRQCARHEHNTAHIGIKIKIEICESIDTTWQKQHGQSVELLKHTFNKKMIVGTKRCIAIAVWHLNTAYICTSKLSYSTDKNTTNYSIVNASVQGRFTRELIVHL